MLDACKNVQPTKNCLLYLFSVALLIKNRDGGLMYVEILWNSSWSEYISGDDSL